MKAICESVAIHIGFFPLLLHSSYSPSIVVMQTNGHFLSCKRRSTTVLKTPKHPSLLRHKNPIFLNSIHSLELAVV